MPNRSVRHYRISRVAEARSDIPGKGKTTVIYGKPIAVEKKPADQITHDDLRTLTDRVTMEIQKMSGQEYVNEYAQKVKEQ